MTASLSGLFRSLFPAIVLMLCLIVLAGAGGYYFVTGAALTAVVLAFAGLALVVALFGLVALQIENNELLYRIAMAVEAQAWDNQPAGIAQEPDAVMAPLASGTGVPVAAGLVATRVGTATHAVAAQPQPRGRVEPVVTLRGQPAAYGA